MGGQNHAVGTPQRPDQWALVKSVADELVSLTVRKRAEERVETVAKLIDQVKAAIDRVESGGRVLDFNLPKRCLFCASGTYQLPANLPFYLRDKRRNPPAAGRGEFPFRELQNFIRSELGFGKETPGPIPIYLVCDVCGNIQYFRLDLTSDKSGQKWNP